MWRSLSVLPVALILIGCGDPARNASRDSTSSPGGLYETNATVLAGGGHGPELCLGVIAESLPPQCDGVPITNWNWDEVGGEDSAVGTTWGGYHVVGTYDGSSFTVTDVGPPEDPSGGDRDPIDTPCPEPEGGWTASDPSKWSQESFDVTASSARREPDFSGLWVDYVEEPVGEGDFDSQKIILNAAFTGDLASHEAELRETWGGPLCVVGHDHTLQELMRIQEELGNTAEQDFGLHVHYSNADEVHGVVEIGVITIDPATEAALDERYGEGVVRAIPSLRPVES